MACVYSSRKIIFAASAIKHNITITEMRWFIRLTAVCDRYINLQLSRCCEVVWFLQHLNLPEMIGRFEEARCCRMTAVTQWWRWWWWWLWLWWGCLSLFVFFSSSWVSLWCHSSSSGTEQNKWHQQQLLSNEKHLRATSLRFSLTLHEDWKITGNGEN